MLVLARAAFTSDPGSAPNVNRPAMNVAESCVTLRISTLPPNFHACFPRNRLTLSAISLRRESVVDGRYRSRLKLPKPAMSSDGPCGSVLAVFST